MTAVHSAKTGGYMLGNWLFSRVLMPTTGSSSFNCFEFLPRIQIYYDQTFINNEYGISVLLC
jgi:hypothetical protein